MTGRPSGPVLGMPSKLLYLGRRLLSFQGRSLRSRLLIGALVWLNIAIAGTAFALSGIFRDHVENRFTDWLGRHLDELVVQVSNPAFPDEGVNMSTPVLTETESVHPSLKLKMTEPRFERPFSGLYWQINDGSAVLFRSRSLWDTRLAPPSRQQVRSVRIMAGTGIMQWNAPGPEGQILRVLARRITLPGEKRMLYLMVAGDLAELDEASDNFNRALGISLLVLAFGLALAVLLQVWIGLRPLSALRRDLHTVRNGKKARLGYDYPLEILPLVEDLNALLEHSEQTVSRARTGAGNLAHGLKTPLTIISNEASDIASQGMTDSADRLREQAILMRRQIDYHLTRARAAGGGGHRPGRFSNLVERAGALVEAMRRLHSLRDSGGTLTFVNMLSEADESEFLLAVGQEELDEMLGNLLDNAGKWACRTVRLRVDEEMLRTAPQGLDQPQMLHILVEDDGPGIPGGDFEEPFERGRRLDENVPGSGLGLAIVRDLAGMVGGEVSLGFSALGGTQARLVLPLLGRD